MNHSTENHFLLFFVFPNEIELGLSNIIVERLEALEVPCAEIISSQYIANLVDQ
ncbi:hypothetical protein PHOSAC3_140010 [Mesotoga infera]|nr:hypothetical protein PHOSAC3_140010 [Mesotoga infera]